MNEITRNKLKLLEAKHHGDIQKVASRGTLRVYYGFSKVNKVQKQEAIAIVFENEQSAGSETSRSGRQLRKIVDIVTSRLQSPEEASCAAMSNRVFTQYLIFLDDKRIGGSLEKALQENLEADVKNASRNILTDIKNRLYAAYIAKHPDYREPTRQLAIPFE